MSASRAFNTVSGCMFFGATVGFGYGLYSDMTAPRTGGYNMTGLTTFLLMGTGASAGFVLGVAKALFDACCDPAEESSIGLKR